MSSTSDVPDAVPSLANSSTPCVPSSAAKNARVPMTTMPVGDEPGAPGWYRMMTSVITAFVSDFTSANAIATWYAHEQLAQPGEVTRIIAWLRDQAKLAAFDDHAEPANTRTPTAGRRAQVRAYIQGRKAGDG